jgi:triacylglycerol esterase/lipase EstA (alpha/beta hydrolase family)
MRRFLCLLVTLLVPIAALLPAQHASAATRNPVIFVHGFGGNSLNWVVAKGVFIASGYSSSQLFTYDYNSFGDNRANAAGLATRVNQVKSQTGADEVDIVNHSMGGLVSLWYLKVLGGTENVDDLASIAGANHGTTSAYACAIFVTCQQMIPGSSFIDTLTEGDETPGPTTYATWYSPCDGIIKPYTSTVLDGADNNLVTCQDHLGFLANTTILSQIAAFTSS